MMNLLYILWIINDNLDVVKFVMNIVVIGTSNSVMRNNYVNSLGEAHSVTNLSCGGVSVFFHIMTILKNQEILKNADVVIVDHYINDCNYYHQAIDDYRLHTGNFYKILRLFKKPVINILFPVTEFKLASSWGHCDYVRKLSKEHGFFLLDLNECGFQAGSYADSTHLKRNISYVIGLYLNNILPSLQTADQADVVGALETPYSVITAEEIAKDNKVNISSFKNSLLSVNYLKLQKSRKFVVRNKECRQLLSIGYFNEINAMNHATLHLPQRDMNFSVNGNLYIHEAFNDRVWIDGDFYLSSLPTGKPYEFLMSREKTRQAGFVENPVSINVCDLLFYNGQALPDVPVKVEAGEVEIHKLLDIVTKCLGEPQAAGISAGEIDLIRNAAIELEACNLKTSYELMSIAQRFRPQGSLINKKLEQYREQLGFASEVMQ